VFALWFAILLLPIFDIFELLIAFEFDGIVLAGVEVVGTVVVVVVEVFAERFVVEVFVVVVFVLSEPPQPAANAASANRVAQPRILLIEVSLLYTYVCFTSRAHQIIAIAQTGLITEATTRGVSFRWSAPAF
jgi:hypothetical protein